MKTFYQVGELLGCRHSDARLCRFPQTSGGPRYGMWCFNCRRNVSREKGYPGIWIPLTHPDLKGKNLDALEAPYDNRVYRRCEGPCDLLALCELHHFAPRKFFGDDADRWVTGYLCEACHDLWHTIVTPGLCTSHDSETHATQLRNYLGREKFENLCRAMGKIYRADNAEAAD